MITSETSSETSSETPSFRVLGTTVHLVEIPQVVSRIEYWIEHDREVCHHIVNSGMHGVMEAHRDSGLRRVFESVDLFAPDGILMVLLARLRGFKIAKKNTGPNVIWEFARSASENGYSSYFYGDEETVLQSLETKLKEAYPDLKIVGHRSPPFRALTPDEDAADLEEINRAAPDVLWVGLGMPKQERWIFDHRAQLNVPVAIGAGAAFKFVSGEISRGPEWVQNMGFEWLWRLISEPKRIWKRVFVDAPQFIGLVALEITGLRKFN
ncbi:MAG: WecB/TagA/CpsF family glycosyltransferase [Chloroflexi bacterium]|nr:WecB/TagA/CpsF family glycosyltransferase [Chloroflexota bacterium]MDA1271600.1 WecB/TagA/CpsF family glycosyltransferase [Chloroflexota bacterium]